MGLNCNVNGSWVDAKKIWVNVNGNWVSPKDIFVNVNGTWKGGLVSNRKAMFCTTGSYMYSFNSDLTFSKSAFYSNLDTGKGVIGITRKYEGFVSASSYIYTYTPDMDQVKHYALTARDYAVELDYDTDNCLAYSPGGNHYYIYGPTGNIVRLVEIEEGGVTYNQVTKCYYHIIRNGTLFRVTATGDRVSQVYISRLNGYSNKIMASPTGEMYATTRGSEVVLTPEGGIISESYGGSAGGLILNCSNPASSYTHNTEREYIVINDKVGHGSRIIDPVRPYLVEIAYMNNAIYFSRDGYAAMDKFDAYTGNRITWARFPRAENCSRVISTRFEP